MEPVEKSRAGFQEVWQRRVKATTDKSGEIQEKGEDLEALLVMPSKITEDAVRQDACSIGELLTDAAQAHRLLKARLAPGTEWAEKDFDAYVAAGHGGPRLSAMVFGSFVEDELVVSRELDVLDNGNALLPGGYLWDPGIRSAEAVNDAVAAIGLHDDDSAFRDVTDVSRLVVIFGSAGEMLTAIECVHETCDVITMDNRFQNPTCMGVRNITFVVRNWIEQRAHLSELIFSFRELESFARKDGNASR